MIDNDMHVLRSSTQPRQLQGNDDENNDASIYDMDNYEAAPLFEEQLEPTIEEDSSCLYDNVFDIKDYSVTMSDIDDYSATMSDIKYQDNEYYDYDDDNDDDCDGGTKESSLSSSKP